MRSLVIISIIISAAYPIFLSAQPPTGYSIIDKEIDEKSKIEVETSAPASDGEMPPIPASVEQPIEPIILNLNGSSIQRVFFYDRSGRSLQLFGRDELKYTVLGKSKQRQRSDTDNTKPIILIVKTHKAEERYPLLINGHLNSIEMPGSSTEPVEAFIENFYQLKNYQIKITIVKKRRKPLKEDSKVEIRQASPSNPDLPGYKKTSAAGLRLRSGPNLNAPILGHIDIGTVLSIITEENGWYKVKIAEDKVGWVSRQYIEDIH